MNENPSIDPVAKAQLLLRSLNITTVPVPIERIAKALGAQIRFSPFDEELSGMIFIKDGVPVIGVNSLHHPNRQRFTIAHELGHLELHREEISSSVHVDKTFPALMRNAVSSTGQEKLEREANSFAAELIMPRFAIEAAFHGKQFDIEDAAPVEALAKKLRVSRQALENRIRSLADFL